MKIGTRKSRQDNKKWKYLPETVQARVMQFEVSILHAYRVWKLTRLCMSYRTSGQLRSSAKSHSSNYAVYMRSMMLYSGPWLTSAVSSVLFSLVLFCGKLWAITTIGLCDNCNLVKPSNLCYESECMEYGRDVRDNRAQSSCILIEKEGHLMGSFLCLRYSRPFTTSIGVSWRRLGRAHHIIRCRMNSYIQGQDHSHIIHKPSHTFTHPIFFFRKCLSTLNFLQSLL